MEVSLILTQKKGIDFPVFLTKKVTFLRKKKCKSECFRRVLDKKYEKEAHWAKTRAV